MRSLIIAFITLATAAVAATAVLAVDEDDRSLTLASVSTEGFRFPDKNTIDLLIETKTTLFDEEVLKSIGGARDGYRLRVKFDERWQPVARQIDLLWSGDGLFGHPMLNGNAAETYLHVRDDGSMVRFHRKNGDLFALQAFDEKSRTWGPEEGAAAILCNSPRNLRTCGNRWECIETGDPPTGVAVYDLEQRKQVKDEWLETTITANLKHADFRGGTGMHISNEKNYVLLGQRRPDRDEFVLFGFGMIGTTKYVGPRGTSIRGIYEARDGRAAVLFVSRPDIVYAHEIDRRSVDRTIDFKEVRRVRSEPFYAATHATWYHAENRTIVGVDTNYDIVEPSPSIEFTSKARVVRWNLESGNFTETAVPVGEHFHVVDRHVVPKSP